MSWISQKWDEVTGRNMKVPAHLIRSEYQDAYSEASDDYGWLKNQGREMMDPNSPLNMMAKERMDSASADSAAEAARLSQRTASSMGGAPAGVMAAQTANTMNQAQAGSLDAFNQYLQGQYQGGVGMFSGAAGNLAQLKNRELQAFQGQRQANNIIDSQATMKGMQMLGGAGQMMFGLPPTGFGAQEGGYIYGQRGGMLSRIMGPRGPMDIKTRLGGQLIG